MNSKTEKEIVGVYNSQREIVDALKILKHHKFPLQELSVLGEGLNLKEIKGVHTWEEATTFGTELGAVSGLGLGILVGLSIIAIPGAGSMFLGGGFLGAFLGGVEGLAMGGVVGGIIGTTLGAFRGVEGTISGKITQHDLLKYEDLLRENKYLIIAQDIETATKAQTILTDEQHNYFVEAHTASLI